MVLVRNHSVSKRSLGSCTEKGISALALNTQAALDFHLPSETLVLESPVRVIHRMIQSQSSGRLTVVDPRDPMVFWQVFIGNGQVHFATSLVGQRERLNYFLRKADLALSTEEGYTSDYQFLCTQWQQGRLTLTQLRSVLVSLTQDALLQVLKLPQAKVQVSRQLGLDPLLMSMPMVKLLSPVLAELRQWQGYQSEVLSPLQRPIILDPVQWSNLLKAQQRTGRSPLQFIQPFLGHNFCLYQIAQEMQVDLSKVVSLFQGLVRWRLVAMQPYQTVTSDAQEVIVCVDPSATVQRSVKTALEPEGHKVISVVEPTLVWSALEQHTPRALLLDVDTFDGYSFIKALLRSERFSLVPMITLTEHQGLVNRLVSRRLGVLDCLVKPLETPVLRSLIRQAMIATAL